MILRVLRDALYSYVHCLKFSPLQPFLYWKFPIILQWPLETTVDARAQTLTWNLLQLQWLSWWLLTPWTIFLERKMLNRRPHPAPTPTPTHFHFCLSSILYDAWHLVWCLARSKCMLECYKELNCLLESIPIAGENIWLCYWLRKPSWMPITAETKSFPMISAFCIIGEKRMDCFSLPASCSTDAGQVACGCQVTCKAYQSFNVG